VTRNELVEPAFFSCPDYTKTLGPEVGELAALAGFAPDPEQQLVLDGMFALDRYGRSAAFETCVVCCRQNLKTGLFKIAALGKVIIMERPLFVWSAHEFSTAQEGFRDLTILIESTPDLDRLVQKIHRANGDEAIEFRGGQRIKFKARTKSGGRGLTGDDVLLDEAFALQATHMGSLLPTLSARPDPQVIYGSSAGLNDSGVLRGIRDRGRAGKSPRLLYAEWCAPDPVDACDAGGDCDHTLEAKGCGFDKKDLVQRANPQLDRRISWEYVRAERQALPPEEFGRERMGWWDDPTVGDSPIPPYAWARCAYTAAERPQERAFGFSVSPDLRRSVIAVVGRLADGRIYGETVDILDSTAKLVDRLVQLGEEWKPCAVAFNGAGASLAIEADLLNRGFSKEPSGDERRLAALGPRDYASACMALAGDVIDEDFWHPDEQPLNDAVAAAGSRPLGDGWAWSRKSSKADIGPLEALTAARHGFVLHSGKPDDLWAVYA
jgi:hypothetical protein